MKMLEHPLVPFQAKLLRDAEKAEVTVFSGPRGNGKSYLCGLLCAREFPKLENQEEIVLVAGSQAQARIVFRFFRAMVGEDAASFTDSANILRAVSPAGGALRVIGNLGRLALGFVGVRLLIADEPASWTANAGGLLHDAIETARGKPGSPLRVVYVGTLAPAATGPGHWWYDTVHTPEDGKRIILFKGDVDRWSDLRHVFSVNPLSRVSADFRKQLRRERDAALSDSRLKARFLSYRLNVPSGDESTMLLSVENWQTTLAREIAPAHGRQVWGIDLGANRSWCAAINLRQNGRCDAVAVAPGIPSIESQEKRDRVPKGTYRRLVQAGVLKVAEGLRVPPVGMVIDWARAKWGFPALAVSDRFRYDELRDAAGRWLKLEPRVTRWSEAAEDIRALRRMAADGPLSVAEDSRLLLTASLSAATVKSDDQGNTRLVKRGTNNQARDDAAAALLLAAGAWDRATRKHSKAA